MGAHLLACEDDEGVDGREDPLVHGVFGGEGLRPVALEGLGRLDLEGVGALHEHAVGVVPRQEDVLEHLRRREKRREKA